MRLHNLDNTSIKYYLSEDLKKDPALNEQWDRIDNEFFKPWQRYLNEATLTRHFGLSHPITKDCII